MYSSLAHQEEHHNHLLGLDRHYSAATGRSNRLVLSRMDCTTRAMLLPRPYAGWPWRYHYNRRSSCQSVLLSRYLHRALKYLVLCKEYPRMRKVPGWRRRQYCGLHHELHLQRNPDNHLDHLSYCTLGPNFQPRMQGRYLRQPRPEFLPETKCYCYHRPRNY